MSDAGDLLDAVVDALPGGVVVRDSSGEIVYANDWMVQLASGGDDERPSYTLVDEHLRPLPPERVPSVRASRGERFDGEIVGLQDHASVRWLHVSGRPITDPNGTPIAGLVVSMDVTERVDARRRLQRSEQLLRATERIARRGSWTRDLRTGATEVSDGLRAIAGLSPDEPITREALYELFHPDDRTTLFEGTFRTFTEGTPFRSRVRIVTTDGRERLVEVEAERSLGPDGEPAALVGSVHDLTDQLAHEERVVRAERMELVGRLAGGLAHDLNNLLTVLVGHAELLRATATDDQLESLDAIAAATQRAADLTRQLLEFGRRDVLQPRPVDVRRIVHHIDGLSRSVVPSSIELMIEHADDHTVAVVDPLKLEQVVLNLVLNARDALVDRGRIELRTSVVDLVDDAGLGEGRYVRIEIADDGPGMSPEVLQRATEPFFTTKPPTMGTGLGLASASGIVAQSGGRLDLSSEQGVGTTATVLLPWSDAVPDGLEPPSRHAPRSTHPATILLAEDDDHLRPLLEQVLRQRGHRVLVGRDGLDALEVAASSGEHVDLLVTDVSMPGRDGHELATALAAVHPRLQVVFMSGYTENSAVIDGLADRPTDFIAKPFAMSELLDVVDAALARSVT